MRFKALALAAFVISGGCANDGTYAAQCSAALAHWRKPSEGMNHHAIPNRIRLDGQGKLYWNRVPIDESTLALYMDQSRPLNPLPFLILSPDEDAPCAAVSRVRALMNERYCNLRWACGEGHGKWESTMDLPSSEELRRIGAIADNALEAAEK
jgi:hypothetical protein